MFIHPRSVLYLDHPAQLRVLLGDVPAARRDFRSVRVELGGLSEADRRNWEERLTGSMRSTGSDTAAFGYGAAMVLYGVFIWLSGGLAEASFDALSVGVALGVGGAAVGKVIGLMLANRALRRGATELESVLLSATAADAESPSWREPAHTGAIIDPSDRERERLADGLPRVA